MARRKKGTRRLALLAAVVMALLVAEGALVATVFLSPGTVPRLRAMAARAERAWSGTEDSPGIVDRVGGVVERGYRDWIRPLWSPPVPQKKDPTFRECISCHPDYAERRRFTSVYMNHPVHAQLGVACGTCHRDVAHPEPLPVEERVCAACHREVQQSGACGLCHPPASLPHFYLLGAPREGPVECDACHRRGAFEESGATRPQVDSTHFDGTNRAECVTCHEPTTCQGCHAQPHPSNWLRTHWSSVAYEGGATCYSCHTMAWCSDRCHAITPTNPLQPRPLPTGGES